MKIVSILILASSLFAFSLKQGPYKSSDLNQHYNISAIITATSSLYFQATGDNPLVATLKGLGLNMAIGVTKELVDKYIRKTGFSGEDIRADFYGGLYGSSVGMLLYLPFRLEF